MTKIPVMITGVGGGGVGEQILKCLRMSELDYEIIGGDMSRTSKGLSVVDKAYILPPAGAENYVEKLLCLCKRHGVLALFTGSEPELKVVSKNRQAFLDAGVFLTLNPQRVIDICMDKNKTMDWFSANGFPMPRHWLVNSLEALETVDAIPAVLKPSVGGGGSANAFIAQNPGELRMFGAYLLELYGEFIVQEYVGRYDTEYTVGVLNDMEGQYLNAIAVKKSILSGLSNRIKVKNITGKAQYGDVLAISSGISQGQIGRFPEVTEACIRIAEKLGCTGPVNIQCRLQDDKVYVFEINPRISGTSPMRAMVGYNEPDIMVRKYVLGQEIQRNFSYRSGYIVRGLDETFIGEEQMAAIQEA